MKLLTRCFINTNLLINNNNSYINNNNIYVYSNEDFFFFIYSYNMVNSIILFFFILRFFNNINYINIIYKDNKITDDINYFNFNYYSITDGFFKIYNNINIIVLKNINRQFSTFFTANKKIFLNFFSNISYKNELNTKTLMYCNHIFLQTLFFRIDFIINSIIFYIFYFYILIDINLLSKFIFTLNFFLFFYSVFFVFFFNYNIFSIRYFIYIINIMYTYIYYFDVYSFSLLFELIYLFILFILFLSVIYQNNYKNINSIFYFIILNFFSSLLIFILCFSSLFHYGSIYIYNSIILFDSYKNNTYIIFVLILLIKINISPFYKFNSIIYVVTPYFIIFLYTIFYFFVLSVYVDFIQININHYIKYIIVIFLSLFFFNFKIKRVSEFIFFSTILFLSQLILII